MFTATPALAMLARTYFPTMLIPRGNICGCCGGPSLFTVIIVVIVVVVLMQNQNKKK